MVGPVGSPQPVPEVPDPFSRPGSSGRTRLVVAGLALAVLALFAVVRAVGGPAAGAPAAPPRLASTAAMAPLPDTDPLDQWIEWDASRGATDHRIAGYRIRVSTTLEASGLYAARVELTDGAGLTHEVTGEGASWAAGAAFAVTRLDPADPVAQVLVSTFSGGAHCCVSLQVLESREGGWRTYDLGEWDGDRPSLPQDLDGDGRLEFRFRDQAFLYAFAPYADSWAPSVIRRLVDGRVEDMSGAEAFRPVYVSDAAGARAACLDRSNGACAAYVAASARAGRLDAAWSEMLTAYDQESDWTLPRACRVRTAAVCPQGAELTFATFPEALQWFLGENGYTAKVYVEPLDAAGPSFDCGSARTASEQAICRSPALGLLDRTLAVAYTRAHALMRNRAALRASQRAFQTARRDVDDGAVLTGLYEARIGELLAVE